MTTEFACRTCEIADAQAKRTGLDYACVLHGTDFLTREVPFKGYVAGCALCEAAKDTGILPFVRHGNCTCGKRKPHCTAGGCY
jgi:hypothetical protein